MEIDEEVEELHSYDAEVFTELRIYQWWGNDDVARMIESCVVEADEEEAAYLRNILLEYEETHEYDAVHFNYIMKLIDSTMNNLQYDLKGWTLDVKTADLTVDYETDETEPQIEKDYRLCFAVRATVEGGEVILYSRDGKRKVLSKWDPFGSEEDRIYSLCYSIVEDDIDRVLKGISYEDMEWDVTNIKVTRL